MPNRYTYNSQRYYTAGANAVLPEYYEQNDSININRESYTANSKKKIKLIINENLKLFTVAFLLAALVVGQYVYIAGMGYGIVRQENELNQVLNNNEKLKQQYAYLGDLSTVEAYAVNNLGMVKASSSMAYVSSADSQESTQEEEAVQEDSSILKSIVSGVFGIFKSY